MEDAVKSNIIIYNINTIEIKFTKNLKKENQTEDEKQKMNRTMSEKKIKTININKYCVFQL